MEYRTSTVKAGDVDLDIREAIGRDEFTSQSLLLHFGDDRFDEGTFLALWYFVRFCVRLTEDSREKAIALGIVPADFTDEDQVRAAFDELLDNPNYSTLVKQVVRAIDERLDINMGDGLEPPTPANAGKD